MGVNEKIESINRELDSAGDTLNYLDNNPEAFIAILIIILVVFGLFLFLLLITSPNKKRSILDKKLRSRKTSDKIPCYGDLYITYFIASKCNLVDYLSLKGNLISSFYLKWLKKGLLKIKDADESDKESILFFDDKYVNCLDDEIEKELYTITKKALLMANADYFKADDLIKNFIDEKIGLTGFFTHVYNKAKTKLGLQGIPDFERNTHYYITDHILDLKRQVVEFMNFIQNETIIKDYEFESVQVWDNYYIFANLLGLRGKVKLAWFNDKINPNFIKISKQDTFDSIDDFVHSKQIYSEEELINNKQKINKSQKNYVRLLNESSKY